MHKNLILFSHKNILIMSFKLFEDDSQLFWRISHGTLTEVLWMKITNELLNDQFSTQQISQLNITPHLYTCQMASLNVISKVGFVSEPDKKYNNNLQTISEITVYWR